MVEVDLYTEASGGLRFCPCLNFDAVNQGMCLRGEGKSYEEQVYRGLYGDVDVAVGRNGGALGCALTFCEPLYVGGFNSVLMERNSMLLPFCVCVFLRCFKMRACRLHQSTHLVCDLFEVREK